ncbi:hypothetical protein Pla108_15810 [Botrimarina colliarenosi]|uniref:Uncharacterized protein n=1 Tax=Botrimarina colliarenosi TaxID=2528001 RepID=A0A5C6AMZ8_9BACT|nr:hypothetical protein [Botrimarina colliarenosi]TWU00629.1 hypothetical protein Pla108_15810 [Botrimarina colliarenosi]
MRPLLIVLAGACASIGTSLVVWGALRLNEEPYCEVLNGGLVRTTASEAQVNVAVSHVLESNRSQAPSAEKSYVASNYREAADAWFSRPDVFGQSYERASRLEREQVDSEGSSMRIEVIRGVEMPTLVFMEHATPDGLRSLTQQLANELATMGVPER